MFEDIKANFKRGFEAAWAVGSDQRTFGDVYTPDVLIHHNPFRDIEGLEDVKNGVALLKTVFPDQYVIIDETLFDEGGKGIGYYSCYFTHPVSGNPICFRGISFTYMEDGKVKEEISYDDNLSFFLQLGLFRFGKPARLNNAVAKVFFPISRKGPSLLRDQRGEDLPTASVGGRIRAALEAAYGRGKLDALDDVYTHDCVIHNSPYPDIVGMDGLKQYVVTLRTAFPDLSMRVDDAMTEGDEGGAIHTFAGTNDGFLAFFPPTHKYANWRGVTRISLSGGKIREESLYYDYAGLTIRLGLVREGSLLDLAGIARTRGPLKMAKFIYGAGFKKAV
jgi:predicted ester cyclase